MYIVYVLKSDDGRFYKGFTKDLGRRLAEHKSGFTKSTKSFKNIDIVYTEEALTQTDARKREKYLKSSAGRRFLKKIVRA